MTDIAIIGCGVIGAAVACELSRYHLETVVLERENDISSGTTKANSAIIHSGYDPKPGTLMAKLNVAGAPMIKKFCEKYDVPYKQIGSMVLAFSQKDLKTLKRLYKQGIINQVPDIALLNAEQLHTMEPNISKAAIGALYAATTAVISPWEYSLALAEIAVCNGVKLYLNSGVTAIRKIDDGYELKTNKGVFTTRFILNASGVNADYVHNLAGTPEFTIIPKRGEYYLLDKEEGARVSHVIFQCPDEKSGKGVLVAPTVHGNLIVGPNSEDISDVEDTSNTIGGLEYVAEMAKKYIPSIDLRKSIRNFSGVRATSDIDDFIIGESKTAKGFINLAGIKSPGLSAAPAIAKAALEIIKNAGLVLAEKSSFIDTRRRVRFNELSDAEKMKLVRENPAYGRIVCRCENITEGEILDVLRSPIPPCSVDGVKRRCNAGMGRCQGSFCGPRVLEILARENKVEPESVMQDKTGSYILVGKTKGWNTSV